MSKTTNKFETKGAPDRPSLLTPAHSPGFLTSFVSQNGCDAISLKRVVWPLSSVTSPP
jgi:hypothetical protein